MPQRAECGREEVVSRSVVTAVVVGRSPEPMSRPPSSVHTAAWCAATLSQRQRPPGGDTAAGCGHAAARRHGDTRGVPRNVHTNIIIKIIFYFGTIRP